MAYLGSLGGEYSGSTAGNLDPELGTANVPTGMSHVAAFDAFTPGAYAWRADYGAGGAAASLRKQLDRDAQGSAFRFFASGVFRFPTPAQSTGSGAPVTYTATTLVDTGKAWTAAETASFIYSTSGGNRTRGIITATAATTLTCAAGWSNGTPAAGAAYYILPGAINYALQFRDITGEEASVRITDDGVGNLAAQAWYRNSGTLAQQGSNVTLSLDQEYFIALYADTSAAAGGQIQAWISSTFFNPTGRTMQTATISVSGLTGGGALTCNCHVGTILGKGVRDTMVMDFDDVVAFNSGVQNDLGGWNTVGGVSFGQRFYVSPWGLPIADTGDKDWTIAAGGDGTTRYSCLNEVTTAMPDGDTSYLSASASAAQTFSEGHNMTLAANLNVASDDIRCVQLRSWIEQTAGSYNITSSVIASGHTNNSADLGTGSAAAATYSFYLNATASNQNFVTDAANSQWNRANLDITEFRLQAVWQSGTPATLHLSEMCIKVVFARASNYSYAVHPKRRPPRAGRTLMGRIPVSAVVSSVRRRFAWIS